MLETSSRTVWLESIGAILIILLGSGLHFAFVLLGSWVPVALVAAVNESIWEHLKLAFWPGFCWACLMPLPPRLTRRDVFSAKGFSLAITAILIVTVFTAYTAILERNFLLIDIGIFVAAICIGQIVSILLLAYKDRMRGLIHVFGLVLLGLQVVAYSTLTFFPLNHWLFIEARSGTIGIPAH